MSAGIPRFVTVNLQQLNTKFQDGDQVDLDTLQQKGLLNLSGARGLAAAQGALHQPLLDLPPGTACLAAEGA